MNLRMEPTTPEEQGYGILEPGAYWRLDRLAPEDSPLPGKWEKRAFVLADTLRLTLGQARALVHDQNDEAIDKLNMVKSFR